MLQLSVLDQSPIRDGGTAAQALRETVALAQAADRLGYTRFWVAEHHGSGGLASAAPEILIGEIAAATRRIRVGSGGVMLSHYSSLKVAEQFRTLEAFHPGRIDLGIGRAPGGSQLASAALAHGPGALPLDHYPEQVHDLVLYLSDALPEGHRFHGMQAAPIVESIPQVWCLGSSLDSALIAAQVGLPFSFAQFINPEAGPRAVKLYRERFRPSAWCPEPKVSVGISAIAAPTEEEAIRLSWSRYCWRFRRGGIPTVETAMEFQYSDAELAYIEYSRPLAAIGTPAQVRAKIEATAEQLTADEVVLLTITYDFADRVRSYELIADAFGLPATAEAAG